MYLGKEPQFTQFPSKFFNGDGTAMTVSLDYSPPNEAALLVFIDGVRQDTDAYNISGTSLTFTGTVPSGTNNVQVVHMGLAMDVGVPGDDTVTSAKIANDAVSTAKIEDDAVTADKLANSINTEIAANTAKVTNATHTGDVTGATALTIANDAVDIAMLSATGTASASTFLRGDNAWAAAGGFKPAFFVWRSANQSITTTTWTKVEYNLEVFDSDGVFDTTTDYRFTVPSGEAGKYYLHFSNRLDVPAGSSQLTALYINGSDNGKGITAMCDRTWHGDTWANNGAIVDLAVADYCEMFVYHPSGSSQNLSNSYFQGFKLVGV